MGIGLLIFVVSMVAVPAATLPFAIAHQTKQREAKASLFNRVCQPKFAIKAPDFEYLDVDIKTCKITYKRAIKND